MNVVNNTTHAHPLSASLEVDQRKFNRFISDSFPKFCKTENDITYNHEKFHGITMLQVIVLNVK